MHIDINTYNVRRTMYVVIIYIDIKHSHLFAYYIISPNIRFNFVY